MNLKFYQFLLKPWSLCGSLRFQRALVICLGNFQSRGLVEYEFEVNTGGHFLLSRLRAKSIYFYWRYSTRLTHFLFAGLLPRRAAVAEDEIGPGDLPVES